MNVPSAQSNEALRLFLRLVRPRPVEDPYPVYKRLRDIAPRMPIRLPGMSAGYLMTTFKDCSKLLRHPALVPVNDEHLDARAPGWREITFTRSLFRSMTFQSGADHRAGRQMVSRNFTPRGMAGRREEITEIVEILLDRMEKRATDGEPVDLEAELAVPFASIVIGRLMGIPDEESVWLGGYARRLGVVFEQIATADQRLQMAEAGEEFMRGLLALAEERRRNPADDLITDLTRQYEPDDEELGGVLAMLFGAGFDSPASLVGLGTRLFLEHPDQARIVRERDDVAVSAGEELLRFEPPVQLIPRIAAEEIGYDDIVIPRDALVIFALAAANRDPAYATDPETFDVTRKAPASLAFGGGVHYCLGAYLGRLQAELFFPRLLRRFPHMELAGEVTYRAPGSALRGLSSLPVRLVP